MQPLGPTEVESVIYNIPSKSRVHRSLRGAATEQGITLALALPVENLVYWPGSRRLFKKNPR